LQGSAAAQLTHGGKFCLALFHSFLQMHQ